MKKKILFILFFSNIYVFYCFGSAKVDIEKDPFILLLKPRISYNYTFFKNIIIGHHIDCIFIPEISIFKKNIYKKSMIFDFLSRNKRKKIVWPQTTNINCGFSLKLILEKKNSYYFYFEPIIWTSSTTIIIENLYENVWSLVMGFKIGYNFILCNPLCINVNIGFGYRYALLDAEISDSTIPYCLGSVLGINSGFIGLLGLGFNYLC